jgi:hypothetical protein
MSTLKHTYVFLDQRFSLFLVINSEDVRPNYVPKIQRE